MKKYLTYILFSAISLPQIAFAHTGHSYQGFTSNPMHWITSPNHLIGMSAIVIGLLVFQAKDKVLHFAGATAMTIGALMILITF